MLSHFLPSGVRSADRQDRLVWTASGDDDCYQLAERLRQDQQSLHYLHIHQERIERKQLTSNIVFSWATMEIASTLSPSFMQQPPLQESASSLSSASENWADMEDDGEELFEIPWQTHTQTVPSTDTATQPDTADEQGDQNGDFGQSQPDAANEANSQDENIDHALNRCSTSTVTDTDPWLDFDFDEDEVDRAHALLSLQEARWDLLKVLKHKDADKYAVHIKLLEPGSRSVQSEPSSIFYHDASTSMAESMLLDWLGNERVKDPLTHSLRLSVMTRAHRRHTRSCRFQDAASVLPTSVKLLELKKTARRVEKKKLEYFTSKYRLTGRRAKHKLYFGSSFLGHLSEEEEEEGAASGNESDEVSLDEDEYDEEDLHDAADQADAFQYDEAGESHGNIDSNLVFFNESLPAPTAQKMAMARNGKACEIASLPLVLCTLLYALLLLLLFTLWQACINLFTVLARSLQMTCGWITVQGTRLQRMTTRKSPRHSPCGLDGGTFPRLDAALGGSSQSVQDEEELGERSSHAKQSYIADRKGKWLD